jgi:hypothetical protein
MQKIGELLLTTNRVSTVVFPHNGLSGVMVQQ